MAQMESQALLGLLRSDESPTLLQLLHLAPLDLNAGKVGAPLSSAFASNQAVAALARLGAEDAQWIVDLSVAINKLTAELASMQQHHEFWKSRSEVVFRLGPVLGPAADVFEGGPWEWTAIAKRWAAAKYPLTRSQAKELLFLPPQREQVLFPVIEDLSSLLGRLVQVGGSVAMAISAGHGLNPELKDEVADDLRAACARYGQQTPGSFPDVVDTLVTGLRDETRHGMARPAFHRNWLRFAITGVAVVAATKYVVQNYGSIEAWLADSYKNMSAFIGEHVVVPAREIAGEVFGGKRLQVADETALKDAKNSLQKMLEDFYGRLAARGTKASLGPELANEDLRKLAASLDMRPASDRFAIESAKPIVGFVAGDLLEVVLIQVAFIKKELLSALAAMDAILAENRLNFAFAASLPAFGVTYGILAVGAFLWRSATAPVDTSSAQQRILYCVRDLLRVLDCVHDSHGGYGFHGMTPSEIGKLCAGARRLYTALQEHRAFISFADARRHVEDISDSIQPGLHVGARRRAISRIAHFRFFERSSINPFSMY